VSSTSCGRFSFSVVHTISSSVSQCSSASDTSNKGLLATYSWLILSEQLCLIGFKFLPRYVSRMQVGQEHRPFLPSQAPVAKLSFNAHLALTGSAENESSGVARIMLRSCSPVRNPVSRPKSR
jgi:hypothetical protein